MPIAAANTTDWIGVWYPNVVASLLQIAGPGHRDPISGIVMPRMSSLATISLLGLVTPGVVSVIERHYSVAQGGRNPRNAAVLSRYLSDDGEFGKGPVDIPVSEGGNSDVVFIDAKTYLSYGVDPFDVGMTSSTPWRRYQPGAFRFDEAWEIYYVNDWNSANDIADRHRFTRQLIADWQRAANAAAAALLANATDTTQPAPVDELSEFFSAIRAVCSDLDALSAVAPEFNKIADALRSSLAQAAQFAGKAAAEVANEAGKIAGIVGENALEGFLANAGVYSFIVIGIVIFMFVK